MSAFASVGFDGPSAAIARVGELQQLIAQTCAAPSASQLSSGASFAQTLAAAGSSTPSSTAAGSTASALGDPAASTASSSLASAGTNAATSGAAAALSAYGDGTDGTDGTDTTDSAASAANALATAASYPTASAASYPTTSAAYGASYNTVAAAAAPAGGSVDDGNGTYDGLIAQASAKYGIDPALLHGLIQQESDYNPNAVSSAGAVGLTQIMPFNFQSLGVTNPYDPAQSIDAGAHLLRENLDTFSGNVVDAVAAYNAGAGAVQRYGGVPPYLETQQYVQKVLANAQAYRASAGSASVAGAVSDAADTGATAATTLGAQLTTPAQVLAAQGVPTITLPTVNTGGSFTTALDPAALSAYAQQQAAATADTTPTTGGSTA